MTHSRFLLWCSATAIAVAAIASDVRADIAIENVSVITMNANGEVVPDTTVIIRGGRIDSIGKKRGEIKDLRVIDGRGKWLIPGLADMHVHVENDRLARLYLRDPSIKTGTVKTEEALFPYVANGVLQISVLSAMPETIAQRDDVESGRALGPHMALAAMIDGPEPILPFGVTRVAASAGDGRQAVRDIAADGYDMVKVYSKLDLETFLAIVDEARKYGLPVLGHIPQRQRGTTDRFFVPGFSMVAHAEEFAMQTASPAFDQIGHYAQIAKRNGTWLTSTLTLDERLVEEMEHPQSLQARPEIRFLSPQLQSFVIDHNPYVQHADSGQIAFIKEVVKFNRALIKEFASRGVPIVSGTDSLVPGVVPGFALHDELEALVAAGLSTRAALESATRLPAEWLKTLEDRGEIAVGKRADLVLLEANPLDNISNTRRIAAVIANGRYLARAELDQRMNALRSRR